MINQTLLLAGDDAYNLTKSLRFRSSASAYLNRTPASVPTDGKKFTISFWFKPSLYKLASEVWLFSSGSSSFGLYYNVNDSWALEMSGGAAYFRPPRKWRDPSAWYHIVIAIDTAQATDSNRVKWYTNGVQESNIESYPSQNATFNWNNNGSLNYIARYSDGRYYDGYLAEFNNIDGQALTPSSFGETDVLTGVWKPKKYAGTYGTNGFYLPFTDVATTSGSNAGLGKDFSGNGNYWTTNNISVTAGSTYDSMNDVPTLTSATQANYSTWNPLLFYSTTAPTLSNGNLTAAWNNTSMFCGSTMALPNGGKTYAEFKLTTANTTRIGIKLVSDQSQYNGGWTYVANSGTIRDTTDTVVQTVASSGNNDIIAIAVDLNANTLQFYKNNATLGTAITIANASNWVFWVGQNGSGSSIQVDANFGQQGFAYTPPTGFVALNTFNLPEPSIKQGNKHFNIGLWTSNSSASNIAVTGIGFQPSLFWGKLRSVGTSHRLADAIRGVTKVLNSNTTNAEATESDAFASFDADGFTIGRDTTGGGLNYLSNTGVGWCWKGNGTGSSNTAGSITSTVSANPTAGFSVVTYTGTGSNATVGHGLGVAPSMIIVKGRNVGSTNWFIQHASLGATKYLDFSSGTGGTDSSSWNNTAPTSSVFSVGSSYYTNYSATTYVAYCFAEVAGYSKFGSYTGNGSTDGTFVHCGFRPRFIMIKRSDASYNWLMWDTARNTNNYGSTYWLYPNLSSAEDTNAQGTDFLSNGFKLRSTGADINGGTIIFAAFAENPFKYSLAR